MLVQVRDPCFPASARYLRPVSVRLILGATPAASSRPGACSFLPRRVNLFVPVPHSGRVAIPPTQPNNCLVVFNPVLPFEFINTHCNAFFCTYNNYHEGLWPSSNLPERSFEIFTSLLTQLSAGLTTALSRPPPRPVPPWRCKRSTSRTAKGRVKATRRDATFVAAKPDQGPKPLTSL